MKILFIQNDPFINLAVTQLSAYVKSLGHDVDLLVTPAEKDVFKSIRDSDPDLLGFYCVYDLEDWVLSFIREFKKDHSTPVLLGGPHPTFKAEMIIDNPIDFICRGEGELPLGDLLRCMDNGDQAGLRKIDNIWARIDGEIFRNDIRPVVEDLDAFPVPDASVYLKYPAIAAFHRYRFPVVSNRGCPYNCTFCFAKPIRKLYEGKGKYLRRRSPEHVIEEARRVIEQFRVQNFVFEDETFIYNMDWLHTFAKLWKKEINVPYICQTVGWSLNADSVKLLKESNCFCVRVGLEVGDEERRTQLLAKELTNAQLHTAAALLRKHDISFQTFNVFGVPSMTLDDNIKTFRLNRELKTDFTWCSILQPYPGTEITEMISGDSESQGVDKTARKWKSIFKSSTFDLERKNEIINLQKLTLLALKLHLPEWLLRLLIKVPENRIYHLLFSAVHYYYILKTHRVPLIPAIRIARLYRGYYD